MKKLEIIAHKNADGTPGTLVIKPSTSNPEWGSVLVMTTSMSIKDGLINESKRVAAFRAKLTTLNGLGLVLGANMNEALVKAGATSMDIFVKESITPQFEGHQAKINPSTKEVIKTDAGQPIFYNTVLDAEGSVKDIFVPKTAVAVVAPTLAIQENALVGG